MSCYIEGESTEPFGEGGGSRGREVACCKAIDYPGPAKIAQDISKEKIMSNASLEKLEAFAISEDWVSGLCRRQTLKSVRLHKEEGRANAGAITRGIADLRATLTRYEPSRVLDMEEPGLLHRTVIGSIYLAPAKEREDGGGVKTVVVKDPRTLYVCTNATGVRVPLATIRKSKGPRCFHIRNPPSKYIQQDDP